jgi:hypothetical protein
MAKEVTITKPQMEALVKVKIDNSIESIITTHVRVIGKTIGEWEGDYYPLNELSVDALVRALYVGYVVEKTPEEKVKEYYHILKSKSNGDNIWSAKADAVSNVLKLLGKESIVR